MATHVGAAAVGHPYDKDMEGQSVHLRRIKSVEAYGEFDCLEKSKFNNVRRK